MDGIRKPIIEVGQQVRFDPFHYINSFGSTDIKGKFTYGTIVYINKKNKWFSVEYGSPALRTSFKICDIGKVVKVCGNKTHC